MKKPSPTEERAPQSRCRFALAWCDITPSANIYHRMWGAAKHERATGVHRPLRATVAVFAPLSGDEKQIVLSLDHCVMGRTEHEQLVSRAAKISGVKADEILVVFSHTHGAGLMALDRVSLPGGDLIPPYLESLGEKAGTLSQPLTCTSCHNPHGSPNYRMFRESINNRTVSVLAFYGSALRESARGYLLLVVAVIALLWFFD